MCSQVRDDPQAVRAAADSKIPIPPGSRIRIYAGQIALPGGSDLIVQSGGTLCVGGDLPGTLTIAGSDITSPDDHKSNDVNLPFPVWITPQWGAKITVNGVAEVTLPVCTKVTGRYREPFYLSREKSHSRLPAGPDSLAGTVGMVILAALVTMFAIGAQIGIVLVLAAGLSEVNTLGRLIAWVVLVVGGLCTLWYSVTAIRTLVDPQPGSSMSSTAGTSFTL